MEIKIDYSRWMVDLAWPEQLIVKVDIVFKYKSIKSDDPYEFKITKNMLLVLNSRVSVSYKIYLDIFKYIKVIYTTRWHFNCQTFYMALLL